MESGSIKRYMLLLTIASLLVSVASASVAGGIAGRAEMRAISHDVVREEWLATLAEETKRIALEAAREAADRAIRETVTPIAVDVAAHRAMDDQRQVDVERRVSKLEERRR